MKKTIYYNFTFLNEMINLNRTNKYKAAKIKRETTFAMYHEFYSQEKIKTPVRLKFTWLVLNKRRDLDNLSYAVKEIVDGMVKAKVIPNDNLMHIIGLQHEFKISDKIGVIIEVIE